MANWRFYSPGERKGNKTILARASIAGKVYEFPTETTNPKVARRVAAEFEARVKARSDPIKLTFEAAVERYRASKAIAQYDVDRLDQWVAELGKRRAADLLPADFHDIANRLHARHSAATKNRFMRPAIAAWHYIANTGLIPYQKVVLFDEPEAETRAVTAATAATLIEQTRDNDERRLLIWLFHQGSRISATLRQRWDDDRSYVDLDAGVALVDIRKGKPPRLFPLHPVVIEELSKVPQAERHGKVFRWSDRSSLRRWLPQVAEAVGVRFTPHMARHTVGVLAASNNAGDRAIGDLLGHDNIKSTRRYTKGNNVTMARAAQNLINLPQGKKLGKA